MEGGGAPMMVTARAMAILSVAALTAVAGCKEQVPALGRDAGDTRASDDQASADSAPVGCASGQHACGTACFNDDDPASCGTCDHDCTSLPNVVPGSVQCQAGQCLVPADGCLAGHAHCTASAADICETDLTTAGNCGACGKTCDPSVPFGWNVAGAPSCVLRCDSTAPDQCGTSCVDLKTDMNNCGACGKVCSLANAMVACMGGACVVSACKDGFADCT